MNIEKYFKIDDELRKKVMFYSPKAGKYILNTAKDRKKHPERNDEADFQVKFAPTPINTVLAYVNELLNMLKENNGGIISTTKCDTIHLDGKPNTRIDNGIIIRDCEWKETIWKNNAYVSLDDKYITIKDVYNLKKYNDLLWLKFTTDGYLGVVAKGCDINFSYENTSGLLVKQVKKQWDTSLVIVFPLTDEIFGDEYDNGDIELAVGQFLMEKQVRTIDYYSHLN